MKNNAWKVVLIVIAGIIAVGLMAVFGIQGTQNKAIALEEQVNTANSDIKVQEKRRVNLVYNLADCVKQYDKHEAETLTAIVEKRGSTGDIENVTTAITAVSEAYPELKSDANYRELMNELSTTENLIAQYRSNYNKQIKAYNRYVKGFPARLFLDRLGYEKQTYTYLDYDAPSDAPQKLFRYEWIWQKANATGFLNSKKMPLKCHENILVFYKKLPTYSPQMRIGFKPYKIKSGKQSKNYGDQVSVETVSNGERYPIDIIQFAGVNMMDGAKTEHPTQKPVDLLMYLIRTYSKGGGCHT